MSLLEGDLDTSVVPHGITEELTQSYIDYAMSVIVSRALPDTRDWLKPVLRRILYAMYEIKVFHNSSHKKSARIVWEVLGKYHPHGDTSVYDAMVRLAQPFSLRYPLIDWQGNFGSIDGDGAAAMRYTEARLTKLAEEMLSDLELNTIDWRDNFDGSLQEPIMLPTRFPNHLCNGTMGIAVWMATNMAPHNLNEVVDASLLMIDNPDVSVDSLMDIIQGPDFPTGWIMFDRDSIREVYKKWRGSIVTRWKTHLEQKKGDTLIVIDEIPYLVNKSNLVAKIGDLVVNKKINGVTDITDESSKNLIRVVITLKKWIDPNKILMQLYKYTELQSNFNINNVTLIEWGIQPRMLNIADLLAEFVEFRRKVVDRRSAFLLQKAKDRLHILEGLKKAIDILDDVIATIRGSATKDEAKLALVEKFTFTEVQSEYILQMRLQSLVGLEIQKVLDEIDEKRKLIDYLEWLLADPLKRDTVVKDELLEIKLKYGDERRTQLSNDMSVYDLSGSLKAMKDAADKIKEDVILWVGDDHTVRVLYQSRILAIPDETLELIYTHNQDKLLVITNKGELVVERLKDLWSYKVNQTALDLKKHYGLTWDVVFARTVSQADYKYLCFLTNNNSLKKIKKELLLNFKKFPTICMGLASGEYIVAVRPVVEWDMLAVVTKKWIWLIFWEEEVRDMGKTAGWVKAIDLEDKDEIADMFVYKREPFLMIYWKRQAKLLNIEDLRIRKRAKHGDQWADVSKGEKIQGGMSVIEGKVRMRLQGGTIETVSSDDIFLAWPQAPLHPLASKDIELAYRPREEKEENMKYKDERKTEKWEDPLFEHDEENLWVDLVG